MRKPNNISKKASWVQQVLHRRQSRFKHLKPEGKPYVVYVYRAPKGLRHLKVIPSIIMPPELVNDVKED